MTGTPPPSRPGDDPWDGLRRTTQARIGLGRAGSSLPTRRVLEFRAAHAAARDAVHEPLDVDALAARVSKVGLGEPLRVRSLAEGRAEYLRRPDLGRRPADLEHLRQHRGADLAIVLADGLSPRALTDHAIGVLTTLVDALGGLYRIAPPVIATQSRVALGDHVGEALGVQSLLVVIGERPGLSVADSLGIYLTHDPRPGRSDAERNCISNIHPPEGLGYDAAGRIAVALVQGSRQLGRSGVALKDSSAAQAVEAAEAAAVEHVP
ncbi:ethanolamine ammonia-lyase subunit EutC [Aeromicrobium sp. Leaf245]|uniref:ethanolamine ammonia-lyase subunit EutC n=1 Tax=Aeromicrobium sp. Leaf245 TaxID=1736306 RepID=UPI0006FCE31E|nr:ethanolamine ammonia-lyase subunit EutC [Aeromicrobium sp. Leaf245]KQO42073.1 ethanolamine ammonia-lyase [Aeromicrobium sp. Leaf245]